MRSLGVSNSAGFSTRRRFLAGIERAFQVEISHFELALVGTTRRHGKMDSAHAGAHLRAQSQQLQADRLDRGVDKLRMPQRYPAQVVDKNIGQPGEPQPQLVCRHGR